MTCCQKKSIDQRFVDIGRPRRIWSIPAIHSHVLQLVRIHDQMFDQLRPGDRIIYLGNYIGYDETCMETLEEILTFRRMVLALPGFVPSDLIYLKGVQEEMWLKLLELQFAPNPYQVIAYMLDHGMGSMLRAFGTSEEAALRATRKGTLGITHWTGELRENIRRKSGVNSFFSSLKRAAFTTQENCSAPVLFVNSGINPNKKLDEQADSFWWSGKSFNKIDQKYEEFHKVYRGFDPNQEGPTVGLATASIDGGCGFGGPLLSALIDPEKGEVENFLHSC